MNIHVQIKVVKMEVMSPICIHCHVGVSLDMLVSSMKMVINHLFQWLKLFGKIGFGDQNF
jgi:hypothetical protein